MSKDFNQFKKEVKNKNVGVMGIGVSNIPLIEMLVSFNANVVAFDKREFTELDKRVDSFKDKVKFSLGENYLDESISLDIIFKTPGMRYDTPFLVRHLKNGVKVTSEMEEFLRYCKGYTIGITGSDGKTTTTTIIGELLKTTGKDVYIGGNIGKPLFNNVEKIKKDDFVVLELSSFQLMTMDISPHIAIVTNISPNHLDMHRDYKEYIGAKKNIFLYQKERDYLIINGDNKITSSFKKNAKGKVMSFSSENNKSDAYLENNTLYLKGEKLIPQDDLRLKGNHNAENFLAAFLSVYGIVSKENMIKVGKEFSGVKHRCEFIREYKGVKYYNDSIASSPTRTLATIKSFNRKVNIILGGYDKKLDYMPLAKEGYEYIQNIILFGDTSEDIKESFEKIEKKKKVNIPIYSTKTFEDAISKLISVSEQGDISILSPASASFDMFKNFEERGDKFRNIINNL
ncbi:MAG: UDP-N-acetylmuramoyl-L-alanine--D-glutamate ligase [Clostridium sp.]|nr:UDP-N-acetylmuramoyl-L-alanine--D-glutamate ligase [Clostridium sp.]